MPQKAEVALMPRNPPGNTRATAVSKQKGSDHAAEQKKKRNLLLFTMLVYSVSGCVEATFSQFLKVVLLLLLVQTFKNK